MLASVGVISVLISWLSGLFLLHQAPRQKGTTISQLGTESPGAYLLLALTLIVAGTAFYVFIIRWLVPHLQLGTGFVHVATFTLGLNLLTGAVPDHPGWRHAVHYWSALVGL